MDKALNNGRSSVNDRPITADDRPNYVVTCHYDQSHFSYLRSCDNGKFYNVDIYYAVSDWEKVMFFSEKTTLFMKQ